jgi:hypothetical protein
MATECHYKNTKSHSSAKNVYTLTTSFDDGIMSNWLTSCKRYKRSELWILHSQSYHIIKEKIQRYNNEAMIPPKLEDMWITKIAY